ncbi:hypothetical protein ES5_02089, partial [Dietzia cinnamea P4]
EIGIDPGLWSGPENMVLVDTAFDLALPHPPSGELVPIATFIQKYVSRL